MARGAEVWKRAGCCCFWLCFRCGARMVPAGGDARWGGAGRKRFAGCGADSGDCAGGAGPGHDWKHSWHGCGQGRLSLRGREGSIDAGGASARTATSDSNGQFQFSGVAAGAFQLAVSSSGFGTQTVSGALQAGESHEVKAVVLAVTSTTDVRVNASQVEIAQEQLRQEEKQRVFGVIPNFYIVYDPHAAPLTSKQKFNLAWKSLVDPVTFLGVGASAGIEQATNEFKGYGQGAQGYGKRFGAGYTDGFTNTMIGGAILASWWKQDPRYFQKGTGTVRSRVLYAIAMSVMCKGDNGHWQVTYAAMAGGLASGGYQISTTRRQTETESG